MIANCHCGNIIIEVEHLPASITSCNCSICHRLGALWGYYTPEQVNVSFRHKTTSTYIWGEKEIVLHTCPQCGCSTHYTTTDKVKDKRVGLNCRMMDRKAIESIPIKYFDGANSWEFIDKI